MSKQSLEERNDKERKKCASLTGFSEKTIHQRLKNLQKVKHKGYWRRSKRIRVSFKVCKIIWEKQIGEEDTGWGVGTFLEKGGINLKRGDWTPLNTMAWSL